MDKESNVDIAVAKHINWVERRWMLQQRGYVKREGKWYGPDGSIVDEIQECQRIIDGSNREASQ